jgi:Ca2+/Na+ antiporter
LIFVISLIGLEKEFELFIFELFGESEIFVGLYIFTIGFEFGSLVGSLLNVCIFIFFKKVYNFNFINFIK